MIQKPTPYIILLYIGNVNIIQIYLPVCNIFSVTNVTINEVDQPLISDVIEVSVVSIHYSSAYVILCMYSLTAM